MSAENRSRMFMSPEGTALLIVDVQTGLDLRPPNAPQDNPWGSLSSILQSAQDLSLPIITTLLQERGRQQSEPLELIAHLPHYSRSELNPWEHEPVRQELSSLSRDAIVIAGNCADGGASFAALGALELGYQPYVVVDAIGAASDLELTTALARWTQAGSIAITSRQLLLEWSR